jgi:hypothetical protein
MPVYFRGSVISGLYTSVALIFQACILLLHCYSRPVYFRGTVIPGLYTFATLLFHACILPWHCYSMPYTSVALLFQACILPWYCYSRPVYFRGAVIPGLYTSVAPLCLHEILLLIQMTPPYEQTGIFSGTFCGPDSALPCGRPRSEALKIGTKPPVLNLSCKDYNSSVGHVIVCLYRPQGSLLYSLS